MSPQITALMGVCLMMQHPVQPNKDLGTENSKIVLVNVEHQKIDFSIILFIVGREQMTFLHSEGNILFF